MICQGKMNSPVNHNLLVQYYSRQNWNEFIDNPDNGIIDILSQTNYLEILEIIDQLPLIEGNTKITPMFSSVEDSIIHTVNILVSSESGIGYDELGELLPGCISESTGALKKYGECHGKLLASVGLAKLYRSHSMVVKISKIGKDFYNLDNNSRYECFTKMILAIPTIQNLIKEAKTNKVSITEELEQYHNGTTVERRAASSRTLLRLLRKNGEEEVWKRLNQIVDY